MKHNTPKLLFALTFVFCLQIFPSFAQNFTGKKAPDISSLIFTQPASASLQALDGKIVVLEFWATWCTPCLANQPHLNQLQTAFKDQDVIFISITDEPMTKVERFLKKREMKGWIACDTGRKVFSALLISAIPRTLIVGKNGTIVYDGKPEQLSEAMLNDVLKGRIDLSAAAPEQEACPKLGSWSGGTDPAFTVHHSIVEGKFPYQHIIRKSVGTSGTGYACSETFSGMTILGQNLAQTWAFCLSLPGEKRILNASSVDKDQKWDIIFSRNRYLEPDTMGKMILLSLKETFGLKVKDTVMQRTALVPVISSQSKVMREKTIDFDDPAAKSYTALAELYGRLENMGIQMVDIREEDSHIYLDTYEITSTIYKMDADTLKKWMNGKGITFSEQKANINMVVIR